MGLTFLELQVANPASLGIGERLQFLIDSGAIYSVVPAAVLAAAVDIVPLAEREFRLANGSKIRRAVVTGNGLRSIRERDTRLLVIYFAVLCFVFVILNPVCGTLEEDGGQLPWPG